ncbi:co-chaperone DjlA [Legionella sp. km772]|uniref:co-chaperone DjlA n=1 Tax=Legionella sp. km772 TaxID=2498111 RepID=UPI000F8C3138|nr:co-chaperone DjlA [Legionella sp. km772]RUR11372.1 co-chaperone DjlA [Legionella sp. km772]
MTLRDFFTISSWWGKLIGGLLGYMAAGSIGAFIGLLVGNLFDKGLASHFARPHFLYHAEKKREIQKIFFEATFAVMGHIAKADGRVSAQEIQMAKVLMKEMRLNRQQKELAQRLFNEGKQLTFRLDLVLNELRRACRTNRELLKLFIDIQYRAAHVDGLSIKKIKALDMIFSQLGFAPLHQQFRFYEDFSYYNNQQTQYGEAQDSFQEEYQRQQHSQRQQQEQQRQNSYQRYQGTYQKSSNSLDHAYALLEVSPQASKQEVKKAYRRLLSKNHPDKLIAQGLPEAMIKIANEKTHKIMKAYELICETKGWT